ncbi:MAG: RNase adapter RapZ [Bacillota bacterium]|nr:RNase adapter RapZ [Bacillota bacterium]
MKVVIVTGLSGAGKTQTIDCLEDMGFYCIENMPPALIKSFIALSSSGNGIDRAAFTVDVRGGELFADLSDVLRDMREEGIEYKIIFLEASDSTLIKRYSETRRPHPLADGGPALKGISKEREMLSMLRNDADYVIDTSNLKTAQLWAEIKHILDGEESEKSFMINIMSFGYKKGIPIGGELVFDMRFIPNPYYVKSLRKLTGNNKKIQDYVLKHQITQDFLDKAMEMIEMLIPFYIKEGKYNLAVCIGCTGGHHRSVAVANELNRRLTEKGRRTTLEHRDIKK